MTSDKKTLELTILFYIHGSILEALSPLVSLVPAAAQPPPTSRLFK